MSPSKKPPKPPDFRSVAEGAARAAEPQYRANDSGLGPVGEQVVRRLTPENEGDPEDKRDIVWFNDPWRKHIRRMDPARLDAVYARATRDVERAVLARWWGRTWKASALGVATSFAGMHWFSDQIAWIVERVPALKALWKLITEGTA